MDDTKALSDVIKFVYSGSPALSMTLTDHASQALLCGNNKLKLAPTMLRLCRKLDVHHLCIFKVHFAAVCSGTTMQKNRSTN